MNFIQALVAYRKKYGVPQGKAPKKGSDEYNAVMKMIGKPTVSKSDLLSKDQEKDKKNLAKKNARLAKEEEADKKRLAKQTARLVKEEAADKKRLAKMDEKLKKKGF